MSSNPAYQNDKLKMTQDFYKGKNVLVTGGCGFIGSHLVKKLGSFEARLRVFDRAADNNSEGVTFIEGDIRDYEAVRSAMKDIDIVFHLAAVLGVERISTIPHDVLEVNLKGTINALKAAREAGVQRFVFSSSSEVYGEPQKLPITEEDDLAPISTYGISKLAAEAYCKAYFEQFGLKTTRLRYFNAYGPGQREQFVMPIFIAQVLRGQPPVIYGNGEQSRSYTYIDDAIEGTILAGATEEASGEVFNIGNDEEVSILELAQHIIKLGNNNLRPSYKPFGAGIRVEKREILKRRPDISKARSMLGFRITTPWREGVVKFWDWYRS